MTNSGCGCTFHDHVVDPLLSSLISSKEPSHDALETTKDLRPLQINYLFLIPPQSWWHWRKVSLSSLSGELLLMATGTLMKQQIMYTYHLRVYFFHWHVSQCLRPTFHLLTLDSMLLKRLKTYVHFNLYFEMIIFVCVCVWEGGAIIYLWNSLRIMSSTTDLISY